MQRPSKNVITLRYGATTDPYAPGNPHIGVDFSSLPDDKIYMPEDGVVQLVPDDGTCGRSIHIMVGNRHHALCHTNKYLVNDGQYCNQGKAIAIMGDTGRAQGVHLHWALKVGGKFVDPIKQVKDKPKEQDVKTSRKDAIMLYQEMLGIHSPTESQKRSWTGREWSELVPKILKDKRFTDRLKGDPTSNDEAVKKSLKDKIMGLVKGA